MSTIEETVDGVVAAPTWDDRVARLRQIPAWHVGLARVVLVNLLVSHHAGTVRHLYFSVVK
jgi:hypothetical protein